MMHRGEVIRVEKDSNYKECLVCNSSVNVSMIILGSIFQTHSVKLCAECISELLKNLEE